MGGCERGWVGGCEGDRWEGVRGGWVGMGGCERGWVGGCERVTGGRV